MTIGLAAAALAAAAYAAGWAGPTLSMGYMYVYTRVNAQQQ
jgi:hypothetical protein